MFSQLEDEDLKDLYSVDWRSSFSGPLLWRELNVPGAERLVARTVRRGQLGQVGELLQVPPQFRKTEAHHAREAEA